jgi:hypothetical protein
MRRPLIDKRILGPFFTLNEDDITSPPKDIEPPDILDENGDERYWTDLDNLQTGITGLYLPNKSLVLVGDREDTVHADFIKNSLSNDDIPDMRDNVNVPFALVYTQIQGVPGNVRTAYLEIPQTATPLLRQDGVPLYSKSTGDISATGVYHIIYALMSISIQPETEVTIESDDVFQRMYLDELYSNLPLIGLNMVPDRKIETRESIQRV